MKKTYHHGDLKNAMVSAGETLLAKFGPAGVSLRMAAKLAGVSHAAPYRHFRDKAALLAAIAEQGFTTLADEMARAAASSNDPLAQLREAARGYMRLALAQPHTVQLMFGGVLDLATVGADLERIALSAFEGLKRIIESGQRAGLYRDWPTATLATYAFGLVHGLSLLTAGGQLPADTPKSDPPEELGADAIDALLSGMLIG